MSDKIEWTFLPKSSLMELSSEFTDKIIGIANAKSVLEIIKSDYVGNELYRFLKAERDNASGIMRVIKMYNSLKSDEGEESEDDELKRLGYKSTSDLFDEAMNGSSDRKHIPGISDSVTAQRLENYISFIERLIATMDDTKEYCASSLMPTFDTRHTKAEVIAKVNDLIESQANQANKYTDDSVDVNDIDFDDEDTPVEGLQEGYLESDESNQETAEQTAFDDLIEKLDKIAKNAGFKGFKDAKDQLLGLNKKKKLNLTTFKIQSEDQVIAFDDKFVYFNQTLVGGLSGTNIIAYSMIENDKDSIEFMKEVEAALKTTYEEARNTTMDILESLFSNHDLSNDAVIDDWD